MRGGLGYPKGDGRSVERELRTTRSRVIDVTFTPGASFDSHVHAESYLCLVTRGTYEEWSEKGGHGTVEAGRPMLYRAGSRHAVRTWDVGLRMLHVTDPAGADWTSTLGPDLVGHLWQLQAAVTDVDDGGGDEADRLHLDCLVEELSAESSLRSERTWLDGVRGRLRDEYRRPVSLSSLAADADRHPAHLARAFKARWGMTAGEFVRRVRVAVAVRLLRESDGPLASVALEAGFSDQSHMGRWMRRYLGLTPRQVRRGHVEALLAAGARDGLQLGSRGQGGLRRLGGARSR